MNFRHVPEIRQRVLHADDRAIRLAADLPEHVEHRREDLVVVVRELGDRLELLAMRILAMVRRGVGRGGGFDLYGPLTFRFN